MKRGRSNQKEGTMAGVTVEKSTKKKAKGAVVKAKEVAEKGPAVEEWKELAAKGFAVAEMDEWWMGLCGGVDEEMSWATCWCPFWEMETVGEAYDAFCGDVLWGFDNWDFKASGNNATNP